MFRCTDCQKIYEQKPDYCDCGNNVFDELLSAVKVEKIKTKKSFKEQYPQVDRLMNSLDVLSVSVFLVCIILSILSLIFIQPSKEISENKPIINQSKTINSIPDIDKLWVTKVYSEKAEAFGSKSTTNEEKVNQTPQRKVIKKQQPKAQQSPKTQSQSSSSVKIKQTSSTVDSEKKETKQIFKENQVKEEKVVEKNIDEEMNNYKVALRQALFNNLEVTAITGSGDCVIEFSIAKDGKLINRNFTKQSQNASVNQTVYNMMMKLPYYYAPPKTYSGDKIKLHFVFDNGNYSISYIQ